MSQMPDDLRDLDRRLRAVRFAPRASFGPELLGRLRRGDRPAATGGRGNRRHLATAAAALLAAAGALGLARLGPLAGAELVTVDRCCYDLDGGGEADDGVLIVAERDAKVHRLVVYVDLDDSGSYSAGDLVRLDRSGKPAIRGFAGEGITTFQECCLDFDGGGPDDDGLLVIGVPPDRVLMAAIYETGQESRTDRWLLR